MVGALLQRTKDADAFEHDLWRPTTTGWARIFHLIFAPLDELIRAHFERDVGATQRARDGDDPARTQATHPVDRRKRN